MNKKENMYQQIEDHGKNLLAIFPDTKEKDPIKLCKKLRRLEKKIYYFIFKYSNDGINSEQKEFECEKILKKVKTLLNTSDDSIFINQEDPCGYALKIERDKALSLCREGKNIYLDFGCYGILAPDFSL
jgi:hypothetical protein